MFFLVPSLLFTLVFVYVLPAFYDVVSVCQYCISLLELSHSLLDFLLVGFEPLFSALGLHPVTVSLPLDFPPLVELLVVLRLVLVTLLESHFLLALGLFLVEDGVFFFLDGNFLIHRKMRHYPDLPPF